MGDCSPLLTCGFPAKQTFTDKTHNLLIKAGSALPVKGKVWGKFYMRLSSLSMSLFAFSFSQ